MYSLPTLARKYLHYYFTAANSRGHGVHSPFVYDFIRNVLNDRREYPAYLQVEGRRKKFLKDPALLEITDWGAGSARDGGAERSVKELAKLAAKPRKLGQLLFRIARYYQAETILELGTSLGLSTAYLAAANPGSRVMTIEGAAAIAETAQRHFDELGLGNIGLTTGQFDSVLPELLEGVRSLDLVFIDGNHRLEPTLRYFNLLLPRMEASSILIFDDIHWSEEMEQAWEKIRRDPRVKMTIDLFFIGLVVLRDEFTIKQDFVIRY